eukprot:CAMPEP_0167763056 /NCGR_PEP_ID=MMETSP0110_2-20121227/13132_1 /TAXON_ID=629695 /ORGANISM="Gymnochlora sp., Strain CCMP2014" /LENGTH=299 /DNA_ID=CAMNT_0007650041 /DNA_START=163 /DNA_END=1065 /DNA_ORIENTATION=+
MAAFLARTSSSKSSVSPRSMSSAPRKRRGKDIVDGTEPAPKRKTNLAYSAESVSTHERQLLFLALRGKKALGSAEMSMIEDDSVSPLADGRHFEERVNSARSHASTPGDIRSSDGNRIDDASSWAPAPSREGLQSPEMIFGSESEPEKARKENAPKASSRRARQFFISLYRAVGAVGSIFSPPDSKPTSPPPDNTKFVPGPPNTPNTPAPHSSKTFTPPPHPTTLGGIENNPHRLPNSKRPHAPPPSQVPSPPIPCGYNSRHRTIGDLDSPIASSPRPPKKGHRWLGQEANWYSKPSDA